MIRKDEEMITGTPVRIFNDEELEYLKNEIRDAIIIMENKRNNKLPYGKCFKDMVATEKKEFNEKLKMCYQIFDKLLAMGVREDV